MLQYEVRSGQNIYDVAMTLHGGVEGIFDLLASNGWLTMNTELHHGMVLDYNEEFRINESVVSWIKRQNLVVKNGSHTYLKPDIDLYMKEHVSRQHPALYEEVQQMSSDEQTMFWENLCSPRVIVQQQGRLSAITVKLTDGTHLIVDWGDYNGPEVVEGATEQTLEHCYKGTGTHLITLFGDFECDLLDFTELNGIYYPLGTVYVTDFRTKIDIEDLNKLIIPTEK